MTDNTVATAILNQLGGRRFVAMTGAGSFAYDTDKLTFRLKQRGACRPKNGASAVRITLDHMDTYTVEFIKFKRDHTMVTVSKHECIYNDMLQSLFTKETGLYTSL